MTKHQLDNPKILVIRIRRVGDALLTVPLLNSLKQSLPNSEIHYVVNEPIDDLFKKHPSIDKLIAVPKEIVSSSIFNYMKWVKKTMKGSNYDIIIDCRSTLNTLLFSLFSLKTKLRIGFKKKYNIGIHNHRVELDRKLNKIDELCSLLNPLENYFQVKKTKRFDINITEEERREFKQKMIASGIDFNKPIILCNVACRDISKQWDTTKMGEIVTKMLSYNQDYQLIFNYSGNNEKQVAYSIYEQIGKPERVFIDIEATSLRELGAMAGLCDFFFGNEGGARHITEACGTPTFTTFSPGTSPDKWLPNKSFENDAISSANLIEQSANNQEESFDLITVDVVWSRLKEKLDHFCK